MIPFNHELTGVSVNSVANPMCVHLPRRNQDVYWCAHQGVARGGGPHCDCGDHAGGSVPGQAAGGGGQHECTGVLIADHCCVFRSICLIPQVIFLSLSILLSCHFLICPSFFV